MCLATPGIVESIDNSIEGMKMAKVSFSGVIKNICVEWIPEVKPGNYVLVHAGTALSIVDEKEAKETLELFQQWIDGLDEQDKSGP